MKFKQNVGLSDLDRNQKEFRTEFSGNLANLKRNLENLGESLNEVQMKTWMKFNLNLDQQ